MNSPTDQQLLRDYTGRQSEAAFAELVRRHVDFVYSAALRMVRDAHLAEDVAQSVFVALARNAPQLSDRPVLSGWLHRTTQNLAANAVRSDVRRRAREQEAAAITELHDPDAVWEQVAPHLDNALGELSEADRDALLLRYFQRKSAREMAQTLGTSEEAAQKRVSRAVERLREFLAKRGVTVGGSGLVVVICANAIQAAPVGLAVTISTAAIVAGTSIVTAATATATKAIAMTTLQKTLITAVLLTAVGAGIYETRQASTLRSQVQSLQQRHRIMTQQNGQLLRERDDATNRVVALAEENRRLNLNSAELLKLRGEVARLRQDAKELNQVKASQTEPASDSTRKNILAYAAAQEKRSATNSALAKLAKMSVMLGLTAEQQQPVRDILLGNIEFRTQVSTAGLGGDLSPEETRSQLSKILKEEDQALGTVLTPSQMVAYEQMKTDEANEDIRSYFKYESSTMTGTLKLTAEQAERVFSILCTLKPGEGGPGITEYSNPKEQLEIRLRALEPVLTPKQLEDYRQTKLKQIDEKLEMSNLIKIPNK